MEFAESLAHDLPGLFIETGQTIVYTPAAGVARDVRAIVGQRANPIEFDDVKVDGVQTWVRFNRVDVPELAQGDAITIATGPAAGAYTVNALEPDRVGTVLTFLISSYWIVLRLPTPVAVSDALRKD